MTRIEQKVWVQPVGTIAGQVEKRVGRSLDGGGRGSQTKQRIFEAVEHRQGNH